MQVNVGHPTLPEEGVETWFLLSLPSQGCSELLGAVAKPPIYSVRADRPLLLGPAFPHTPSTRAQRPEQILNASPGG